MKRLVVGIPIAVVAIFVLVPLAYNPNGSAPGPIKSIPPSPGPVYKSLSCEVVGFGVSYWNGSLYLNCSPPVPIR